MLSRAPLNAAARMAAGLAFGALAAIALSRFARQACSQRVQMSHPMPRTPRLDTKE